MRPWKWLGLGLISLLAVFTWLLLPVYGFYAHRGEAPFAPWGWTSLPSDTPSTQVTHDDHYAAAGTAVLAAMERHRAAIGAPAMTAAVAIDGAVVWQGAVGWADIDARQSASPQTIFRVGSTSKAITATALARLVDKGVIDLDARIGTYLDPLPNEAWRTITPRMLASHMAGVPHYGDNGDLIGYYQTAALQTRYADIRDAVAMFDGSPLRFEPGTRFEYSSFGTVLLGAVMSEAAGKPYRDIIRDEVLKPARMGSTMVAPSDPDISQNHATPYYIDGARYRPWRAVDLSHRLPGGGWASTSTDLVRMGVKWLDNSYIAPETRALFWTPQTLASGGVNEQDYAIGWRWREYDLESVGLARNANHGGVSRGGQSWLLVFPDFEMAVAFNINSNTDEFHEFAPFYEDIVREFARASKASK